MQWYKYLGFKTWGQALVILLPLWMTLSVLFTYQNSNGFVDKVIFALIVGFICWLLAWVVRYVFIWMGDVFKKDDQ